MIKFNTSILTFSILFTWSNFLFGQVIINPVIDGTEYLRFELEDRLGNTRDALAGGSYYIRVDGQAIQLTLQSRVQLNKRETPYRNYEARNRGLFWLLFEFRNDKKTCFVFCKIMRDESSPMDNETIVTGKILIDNVTDVRPYGVFNTCEYESIEDDQIFGLYSFKGNTAKPQYFSDIKKAWIADRSTGLIKEIDPQKVRCLNGHYLDYSEGDDEVKSLPSWWFDGLDGVIDDPDGYTNVRSRPNPKSQVVYRIKEGEKFKYWEDTDFDWWKIEKYLDDLSDPITGFMHKSRIVRK